MKCTRFVVWAVFGDPSALRICSQFPWSAVTEAFPPNDKKFRYDPLDALIDGFYRFDSAATTPVWPTMSGLAKLKMIRS